MDIAALVIYFIRGRYYTIRHHTNGDPSNLGKEIINGIPSNPLEYQEWKRATLEFYMMEEKRIRKLSKDNQTYCANISARYGFDYELPVDWGRDYTMKPGRAWPCGRISYQYRVDLETEKFSVVGPARASDDQLHYLRAFRLDKIPRWLFDLPFLTPERPRQYKGGWYGFGKKPRPVSTGVHPVMVGDVTPEYETSTSDAPKDPDMSFVALYDKHSPKLENFPVQLERDEPPVWEKFRLFLLRQFIRRYPSIIAHPRGHLSNSDFVLRQISFAILSIVCGTNNIRFREKSHWYYKHIGDEEMATPWWEPPEHDIYWMGDVLIIVDQDIENQQNLHAAVGKAIARVNGARVYRPHIPETTAIIFSISSIVVAKMKYTNPGTDVTHTYNIPLFDPTIFELKNMCCTESTPQGLYVLFEILSPRRQKQHNAISYPRLPVELCEQIYEQSTPQTQRTLALTCRTFHTIAYQNPRIGVWKLVRSTSCPSEFLANSIMGGGPQMVRIKTGYETVRNGWEVGLWYGKELVELDILLLMIKKIEESTCPDTTKDYMSEEEEEEEETSSDEDSYQI